MCRAATRCTGSASSGISTPRLVNCCRNRTAPDPAAQRRLAAAGDPLGELLRRAEPAAPRAARRRRVERRERPRRGARRAPRGGAGRRPTSPSPRPSASRVPTPLSGRPRLSASARAVAMPDPQAGERAGPDADRDPLDRAPAAGRLRRPLDLRQQRRRVLRPALLGEPEQRLVEHLAVARRGRRRCRRSRCRSRRVTQRPTTPGPLKTKEADPLALARTRSPGACRGCWR